MNYARWSSLLCASLLTAVVAASCSSAHDTADVVPAEPGAFQPDAGGKLIDEASACAALTKAERDARAALGCDAVTHDCPAYIRPAGGADCFVYDQASVDGCKVLFDSFTSCDDFDQRPCLVTAESRCDAVDSGVAAAGGAAGTAGESGRASGGESTVGGEPGTGGASAAGSAN